MESCSAALAYDKAIALRLRIYGIIPKRKEHHSALVQAHEGSLHNMQRLNSSTTMIAYIRLKRKIQARVIS